MYYVSPGLPALVFLTLLCMGQCVCCVCVCAFIGFLLTEERDRERGEGGSERTWPGASNAFRGSTVAISNIGALIIDRCFLPPPPTHNKQLFNYINRPHGFAVRKTFASMSAGF